MGSISVNGQSFNGKSITVRDNRIIIDGKDVTPEGKIVDIKIIGDVEKLSVDCCERVEVNGNVNKYETISGDAVINGNVSGDINTISGEIKCGIVFGDIRTESGEVKCDDVHSSVTTRSGDIYHNKK